MAALYEDALVYETGSAMTSTGALTAYSGTKTGRSPSDKRVVKEPSSEKDVWWGPVNKEMSPEVSHPFTVKIPEEKIVAQPVSLGVKHDVLPDVVVYPPSSVVSVRQHAIPAVHATKMHLLSHGDDAVSATAEAMRGSNYYPRLPSWWTCRSIADLDHGLFPR